MICFGGIISSNAQNIDLFIKNERVIDPKNSVDTIMDVAIDDGKILEVGRNISDQRIR